MRHRHQGGQHLVGPAGRGGEVARPPLRGSTGAQVPVWVVVVVADAEVARSGPTTTSTSAVPMVLTGAEVV